MPAASTSAEQQKSLLYSTHSASGWVTIFMKGTSTGLLLLPIFNPPQRNLLNESFIKTSSCDRSVLSYEKHAVRNLQTNWFLTTAKKALQFQVIYISPLSSIRWKVSIQKKTRKMTSLQGAGHRLSTFPPSQTLNRNQERNTKPGSTSAHSARVPLRHPGGFTTSPCLCSVTGRGGRARMPKFREFWWRQSPPWQGVTVAGMLHSLTPLCFVVWCFR